MPEGPEMKFQKHIAAYLKREHGYTVLDQADITDTEHFIAEDNLWAFLQATQADTIKKLAEDYGTDAREEVFKALRKELERTPLWMLLRHGLPVRGLEFRLFYPKPRSAESAGAEKYPQNRITFRRLSGPLSDDSGSIPRMPDACWVRCPLMPELLIRFRPPAVCMFGRASLTRP